MIEIKFRAFDGKSMRYDVTGFEHGQSNEMAGVFIDGDYYAITDNLQECDSVNPCASVMQFTGLYDENGTEIYESDVVYLAGYGDYIVEFPFIELYEAPPEDICEIKGNIYESPELLK